jgi:cytochrome c-type biogenesis protein CcmF
LLLVLFLRHDFSNGYVYSYSDRSLPLQYLISCFYAGQEGSFLFWALCSAGIGIVLHAWTRKRGSEASVMAVYGGVLTLLLV